MSATSSFDGGVTLLQLYGNLVGLDRERGSIEEVVEKVEDVIEEVIEDVIYYFVPLRAVVKSSAQSSVF